jgi:hypothetical protein
MTALPGKPYPLGATPLSDGLNLVVASVVGEAGEVCLFYGAGWESRVELPELSAQPVNGCGMPAITPVA